MVNESKRKFFEELSFKLSKRYPLLPHSPNIMLAIEDCAKEGGEEVSAFFNQIPIESLKQFVIRTQCISVKNSSPPSLAQSSISEKYSDNFVILIREIRF